MPEGKRSGRLPAGRLVAGNLPAVVDHHVAIARVAHSAPDQRLGNLLDQALADVAPDRFQLFQPMGGVGARDRSRRAAGGGAGDAATTGAAATTRTRIDRPAGA